MSYNTPELDLEWFFCHSQAELGLCSNFEPLRYAIMTGGVSKTSTGDKISDKRINAAHRHRKILEKLNSVRPMHHIDIIYAAFQQRNWSDYLLNAFGRATGVTPFSKSAHAWYEEDSAGYGVDDGFFAWLEGTLLRGETDRIDIIRAEAVEQLHAALKAYSK